MNIYWVRWTAKEALHARYKRSGDAFITAKVSVLAEQAVANMLGLQTGMFERARECYTIESFRVG